MDEMVQTQLPDLDFSDFRRAWEMVSGQLRLEMSRSLYETYIQPLKALDYDQGVFTLGTYNPYTRDWVENRLSHLITRQLEGLFNRPVTLKIEVADDLKPREMGQPRRLEQVPAVLESAQVAGEEEQKDETAPAANGKSSPRKLALQRAYGSKRAAIVQPERSLMVTQYFFSNWVPLIGHSAFAVILAARSLCYWNPLSGELRNELETEMGDLAERAAVSVRTVKSVLNDELVRKYFLRYKTRRIMTPNGVRTAGILLFVRMDDPLTPDDQVKFSLPEDEFWYSPEYGDAEEEE
jgi:hypothetical protein